jgi:host factor-I protein
MPQNAEPRSPAQPNIQDAFLNFVRRERLSVQIHLMDGSDVEARIKHFDRFAVVVEHEGSDQLIFKHAIASIRSPRAVGNYVGHHSA